jgi:hypothetical protein
MLLRRGFRARFGVVGLIEIAGPREIIESGMEGRGTAG